MKWLRHQAGFSIVEVVITMTIASVVVVIVGQFMGTALRTQNREETKTALQQNTKQAVESVARNIRGARRVLANNANPDDHAPVAPTDLYSWASTTGTGSTLVLGMPARDANNNLIFIDSQHNDVYMNDVIYYLEPTQKILYRRTVKNTSAPGNAAVTTCPPPLSSPSCPSDPKVVEDVADLDTEYLDANNNPVSVPSGTEAIKITLKQTKQKGGLSYISNFTSITTLRNK